METITYTLTLRTAGLSDAQIRNSILESVECPCGKIDVDGTTATFAVHETATAEDVEALEAALDASDEVISYDSEVTGPVRATASEVATIRAARVDTIARRMMARGVRLSHDQADDLGDVGIDWLRTRLGLTVTTDDRGVLALPATLLG
jgi:hypothetical protein